MLARLAAVTWQVFGPEAEQAVVYKHVAHQTIEVRLLPPRKAATCTHTCAHSMFAWTEVTERKQDVMHGFNATIFAYGQTGSGKSELIPTICCAPSLHCIT
jgi:hypothetical protein